MYPNSPTFSTTSAIFNLISVINVCVNFPLKLGLVVEFKGQRFTEVCNTEVGLLPDGTTSLPYCTLLNIAHVTSYLTVTVPAFQHECPYAKFSLQFPAMCPTHMCISQA